MKHEQIRFGIVGVCGGWGRGKGMVKTINSVPGCKVVALCDIDIGGLHEANKELGVEHVHKDYSQMLEQCELDAVFIATPMNLHGPQAVEAIERGIHVLSEVPAVVDMEQAMALVKACKKGNAVYMIAENYIYFRENMMVTEMIKKGEFGSPYYAESEYIHGLRWLHAKTKWRRKWQVGINGITYGTHCLGPILQWMSGDRVKRVSCSGAGHHYVDENDKPYEMEDVCVLMGKMESGALIKVRSDLISNGPGRTIYYLQGTQGVFDSDRGRNRIWLQNHCEDKKAYRDIKDLEGTFLPAMWREHEAAAKVTGHAGGDYLQMIDFIAAVRDETPTPLGIHEAMDMTLPGLVSQQSILQDSDWIDVPDSRGW